MTKRTDNGRKTTKLTAKTADRHHLYQLSVQSPEADIHLLARIYRNARGREARHMREDFCGTALMLSHWIGQSPRHTGEGYDIDASTLAWGEAHNFAPLGADGKRAALHCRDARSPSDRAPDLRCAFNFSYWVFRQRREMLDYFRGVYKDLARDGVLVLDIHGGPESVSEDEYESDTGEGFTYVWHQRDFSPVTHEAKLALHFRFADGSQLRRAFRYHWRIWSIPEITDLLREAGFERIECYWEGKDQDGIGDGVFRKTRLGKNESAWIACLAALK